MKTIKMGLTGLMVVLLLTMFQTSYADECNGNKFQPTFVRHNSVAPSYFYVTGNGFVEVQSPAEAQQMCQQQGVRMQINGAGCNTRRFSDFGCGCNITPSPNSTCTAFQNFLADSANTLRNGNVWDETESGWVGVWTRRGSSNTFDASWRNQTGGTHRAVLTMNVTGNRVTIARQDPGGSCNYTGTLGAGTRTVTGTYGCSWAPGPIPWQARIR